MRYGDFEWDDKKASSNVRKHGVSFEEATTAFLDDLSVVYGDLVHADRFVLIGASLSSRLLVVVYAERMDAEVIRIITARRASRQEQGRYEEGE